VSALSFATAMIGAGLAFFVPVLSLDLSQTMVSYSFYLLYGFETHLF